LLEPGQRRDGNIVEGFFPEYYFNSFSHLASKKYVRAIMISQMIISKKHKSVTLFHSITPEEIENIKNK
jgi:hypothetical protein